jgi:hypothetical protein
MHRRKAAASGGRSGNPKLGPGVAPRKHGIHENKHLNISALRREKSLFAG